MANRYKIVVYVPVASADKMRKVLNEFGAGRYPNYDYASFSVRGTGRFRPLAGAQPAVGKVGEIEQVEEERIETVVEKEHLKRVVEGVRFTHPYEEPAIDVIELEDV